METPYQCKLCCRRVTPIVCKYRALPRSSQRGLELVLRAEVHYVVRVVRDIVPHFRINVYTCVAAHEHVYTSLSLPLCKYVYMCFCTDTYVCMHVCACASEAKVCRLEGLVHNKSSYSCFGASTPNSRVCGEHPT